MNKVDVTPTDGRFGIYISTQTNEEDDGTRGHFLYRVTSIAYFFQDDEEGGGSETKKNSWKLLLLEFVVFVFDNDE